MSGNDVENLETFHVETEVDTSEMTEIQLEDHGFREDEIEENRDIIAQRLDSHNLEILYLRGEAEDHDEKLR